jgi:hypothetical protein
MNDETRDPASQSKFQSFFILKNINIIKIGNYIWILAIILYLSRIVIVIIQTIRLLSKIDAPAFVGVIATIATVIGIIASLIEPVLWLMVIRLVLEACFAVLATQNGKAVS